jgi:putative NADH-flavin reductase
VVGISRSPPTTWPKAGHFESVAVDFSDKKMFSTILSEGNFDAVVSAFGPPLHNLKDVYRVGVEGHNNIKMAVLQSSYRGPLIIIGKLLHLWQSYLRSCLLISRCFIGGAGSLYYKKGVQLCDDDHFAYNHW